MPNPRALISVTDKSGVVEFGKGLAERGFEILSTGGTARELRAAGIAVIDVSEVTQFPEMMDGRLKTLHPMVHGALLGDTRLDSHRHQMETSGIVPISILAVNLYAFEETVRSTHTYDEAVESIDIGGPAMIRAAAKNHANVAVIVDPLDYPLILEAIDQNNLPELRKSLMAKAFRHTAYYDSVISRYFSHAAGDNPLSDTLTMGYRLVQSMRYGENPHQSAALYVDPLGAPGVAMGTMLAGKELSYNNILDSDGAWELVGDLPPYSCAIIKHGNPCGAATASTFGDAYIAAREADPISAFGGIAAFNGEVDLAAAEAMAQKGNFLEVILATRFTPEALDVFANRSGWGQTVRLVEVPLPPSHPEISLRTVRGGVLVQETDEAPATEWEVASRRTPTEEEWKSLRFQWSVVKHVKSNAIVVGTVDRLLGVGAGQMNRVQSVRLALLQAGEKAKGAVLASDAFFPFSDSIEAAAEAGIVAVIQPGGSKQDQAVIEKSNELGVAMVFTHSRHFRH
ncbi:MAG: bifunctional phosphoribosylaminoimidazolecarboxamide formyltransferase/IMP cyclohydrolase [Armatimonadetes bacterium]|nr:bifunctional phosphoribosylaminoimidazolecarboxamide formyltransferase/IMP cyclohydrolase [Armatimonadota bacterium]